MESSYEDLGAELADSVSPGKSKGPRVRYATVERVGASTLDVSLAGGTLTGVCMTASCSGAAVGDRVVLLVDGPLVTALGIIATPDNARYVKQGGDSMTGRLALGAGAVATASVGTWVSAARENAAAFTALKQADKRWSPALMLRTPTRGTWALGTYDDEDMLAVYTSKTNQDSDKNVCANTWFDHNASGKVVTASQQTTKYLAGPGIESFMHENQSVTLSENVSAQNHGIVLCWAGYANGATKNYDNAYTFVPKHHVQKRGGQGVITVMSTGNFSTVGIKYVYVSDSKITGNDKNDDVGSGSGVSYKNNHWVLDAVLGV